jgi:hypothetical protein
VGGLAVKVESMVQSLSFQDFASVVQFLIVATGPVLVGLFRGSLTVTLEFVDDAGGRPAK